MIADICHRALEALKMPPELALSTELSIFKGKGDIRNCSCHRSVKLLEHGMKVVESARKKASLNSDRLTNTVLKLVILSKS